MTEIAIPDDMQPQAALEEFELGDKYGEHWAEYVAALEVVEKYKARFKEIFEARFTEADKTGVITLGGVKVGTFAPGKFADAQFTKDNPHLARQFVRTREAVYFDTQAFKDIHPDLYNQYRSRSLRPTK